MIRKASVVFFRHNFLMLFLLRDSLKVYTLWFLLRDKKQEKQRMDSLTGQRHRLLVENWPSNFFLHNMEAVYKMYGARAAPANK